MGDAVIEVQASNNAVSISHVDQSATILYES
jgi:hypothetical protein